MDISYPFKDGLIDGVSNGLNNCTRIRRVEGIKITELGEETRAAW